MNSSMSDSSAVSTKQCWPITCTAISAPSASSAPVQRSSTFSREPKKQDHAARRRDLAKDLIAGIVRHGDGDGVDLRHGLEPVNHFLHRIFAADAAREKSCAPAQPR